MDFDKKGVSISVNTSEPLCTGSLERLFAWMTGRSRSLALMLWIVGMIGFFWGMIFHACWQVAVEGAQVLAGIVHYPTDNPFYIYQIKLWTLLHQLLSLGLRLGFSEKALSILVSGVMGLLCLQVLTLSVYAFARNIWISCLGAALIYLSNAHSYGVNYPIFLVGTNATYGAIGLSFSLLAACLIASDSVRLGGFLLGVSLAVHPGMGALGVSAVLPAVAFEWKKNNLLGKYFGPYFFAGLVLSGVSFVIQLYLSRSIPSIDPMTAKEYFASFIKLWDSHRQPIDFTHEGVRANFVGLILASLFIRGARKEAGPGACLMARMYQMSCLLAIAFSVCTWLPPKIFPVWFLMLMPSRLLNFGIVGLPGLLIGLWGVCRSKPAYKTVLILSVLFIGEPLRLFLILGAVIVLGVYLWNTRLRVWLQHRKEKSLKWFRILMICALAVLSGFAVYFMYTRYLARLHENWAYWKNDALYKKASEGEGLLLLSPDLFMQQLVTRRPVLLDCQALDMVSYALEAAPSMDKILKEVYRVDLRNPPPEAHGMASLPPGSEERLLKDRSTADWEKIRREFGVTQILVSKGAVVDLPLKASNENYDLYDIPTTSEHN